MATSKKVLPPLAIMQRKVCSFPSSILQLRSVKPVGYSVQKVYLKGTHFPSIQQKARCFSTIDMNSAAIPSRPTANKLQQLFTDHISPLVHCEIVNESYMHQVPKDAETHFKVIVVSDRFAGLTPVQRHRLVYATVQSELQASGGTIHALAITAKTAAEWERISANQQALGQVTQRSPPCLGGEKKHS